MREQSVGQITFGKEISSINLNGFILTETFHEPRLVLPRHDHECANINLTLAGSFRETVGKHPQECESASLLVKPPGESHGNKYGLNGAHCLISYSRRNAVRFGKAHLSGVPPKNRRI
jgi:quercetin dioxygenase-like cupin family protein